MVQYFDNGDVACIDGYSFRRDKKTGYYLSSRPIGKRRKRLHVYVWEKYNGDIPSGYEVHHKDMNKSNNEIENLEMLTRSEHAKEHGRLLTNEQKKKMAENLLKYAIPKATDWHKSEEGRKWHKKHAVEVAKNLKPRKYICTFCGNEFETKNRYPKTSNTFCSNNCKSAYRRKMGYDNIEKVCEKCGEIYFANKYQKTKYCENCKGTRNRKNRS